MTASFNDVLDVSVVLLHAFETTSLHCISWCFIPTRLSVMPHCNACFVAETDAGHGRPLYSCLFETMLLSIYSATCPDWFGWTCSAELPLAFWLKAKSKLLSFAQVHVWPLCMINLMHMKLASACRINRRWSLLEIMEIGSGVLKM